MTPRPYQLVGRDFLASRRIALLADEMRVGKTPQAILAADAVGATRVLTLCPAIATVQWAREWSRWSPARAPAVIARRPEDFTQPLVVASYDFARRHAAAVTAQPLDAAIADESHFLKEPTAQRTRLVFGREGVVRRARQTWLLSGTPAPNHVAELWPLLYTAGRTPLGYDAFVRAYCARDKDDRPRGTLRRAVEPVRAMLEPLMLRRKRAEVAPEVPAIAFDVRPLTFGGWAPAAVPELLTMSHEQVLAWIAQNAGSLAETRRLTAEAKAVPLAEQIAEHIQSGDLRQTVVFAHHTAAIDAVVLRLERSGIRAKRIVGATTQAQRAAIVAEFQRGALPVVAANIAAAGTAIDLSAASHGFFLELDWVPANNLQAANRLVSVQKREPVTFDVVTAAGSADEIVQRALARKVRELAGLY